MNDLDRRIAESKGWEFDAKEGIVWTTPHVPRNEHGIVDGGREGFDPGDCCWSTSDAMAFELVDEIMAADPKVCFNLDHHYGGLSPWSARFRIGFGIVGRDFTGAPCDGQTRPEAICRAYLAAREWMAGKEKQ